MNKQVIRIKKVYLILLAIALLAFSACTSESSASADTDVMVKSDDAMMEKDDAMIKDDVMVKDDSMMKNDVMEQDAMMAKGIVYEPITQSAYNQALQEGKTVYLEFYASWCPSCKNDEPNIEEFFESNTNENVRAFRVNYKDSDTDDFETSLAKEYGIAYQHTRVIVQDGEQVYKKTSTFNAKEE